MTLPSISSPLSPSSACYEYIFIFLLSSEWLRKMNNEEEKHRHQDTSLLMLQQKGRRNRQLGSESGPKTAQTKNENK
jgi:hypothetical protein